MTKMIVGEGGRTARTGNVSVVAVVVDSDSGGGRRRKRRREAKAVTTTPPRGGRAEGALQACSGNT